MSMSTLLMSVEDFAKTEIATIKSSPHPILAGFNLAGGVLGVGAVCTAAYTVFAMPFSWALLFGALYAFVSVCVDILSAYYLGRPSQLKVVGV